MVRIIVPAVDVHAYIRYKNKCLYVQQNFVYPNQSGDKIFLIIDKFG